jgi:serine/threonine-protein kinase
MTQPVDGSPNSAGERWNVNMPAVIGIVFVFLVAVIVWVVLSSNNGDDSAATTTTTQPSPTTTVAGAGPAGDPSVPPTTTTTTTPAPMPDASAITTAPTSTPTTTLTSTTVPAPPPATTAPGADPDTVPGDLAVAGHAMQRPGCDDSFITVIASAIGEQATAVGIANVLDGYPGSSYLRTDQTCPSLTQSIDGEPIYVVYFGPFAFASDACAARAEGTEGAYARRLSNDVGPDHGVSCA